MTRMIMVLLAVSLVIACFLVVPGYAQEKQAAPETEQAQETSDQEKLEQWWLYSAKKFDPIYPKWLFHIEGNYAFTTMSGNKDGTTHSGQATVTVRKNVFTNYLIFNRSANDYEITTKDQKIETEKNDLTNMFQIDLSRKFFARAGVGWLSDDTKYIENRYTYYAGVGANIIETKPHFLSVKVYYGYDDLEFTKTAKDLALLIGVELEKETSDGVLFEQSYTLTLSEKIKFTETFGYLKFFEEDKYRWVLNLGAYAQVIGPLGVFASYQIDTNTSDSLKSLQGYEEQDTLLTVGITVSY